MGEATASLMDFGLSPARREIIDWARRFAERAGGVQHARLLRDSGADVAGVHAEMGRAGILAIGHEGGDSLDRALVAEQLGAVLLFTPYFDSAVLAGELLGRLDATWARSLRAEILAGGAIVAAATPLLATPAPAEQRGAILRVGPLHLRSPWLPHATHLLVPVAMAGASGVAVVAADQLRTTPAGRYVDTLPVFSINVHDHLDVEWWDMGAHVQTALEVATDRLLVGLAAFCTGAADRVVQAAAAYATQRRQFGRPIGAFQAQQHKLASALLATRNAQRLTYAAAERSDDDLAAAGAFRLASSALVTAATTGSLVHGGYGLTLDYDVHLYFTYARILAGLYGDLAADRLGAAVRAEATHITTSRSEENA